MWHFGGRSSQRLLTTVLSLAAVLSLSTVTAQLDNQYMVNLYGMPSVPQMSSLYENNSPRQPRSILQNFAVDRMLKDKGFVRSIINCVLDKGPCESNGRKLRLMAPEILRGQCPGCSRTVHQQIRRVISHVQRNFPVEWSEVTRRFMNMNYNNPTGQEFVQPPPPPAFNPNVPDPNMYQNVYG